MQFMFVAESNRLSAPWVLILLGSAGLYVASRAAVDALARFNGNPGVGRLPSAGLLALGHWMPIVALAGFATARGLSHVALGVVFGSSVAALSLAMGLVTYLLPPSSLPASRRAWPFVLTGVMVPLLAGFSGQLTWLHALILLVLGRIAWWVWKAAAGERSPAEALAAALPVLDAEAGIAPAGPAVPVTLRAVQWLLAVALALLGAKMALMGAAGAEANSRFMTTGLLAAAVLSPVIVLPIIASGTDLAHHGRSGEAVSALVGLAMLNLFALLPMVIVFWYVRSAGQVHYQAGLAGLAGMWEQLEPIPLPIAVWRIDLVMLTIIGFAMVPVAMGRWALGRLESVGLIIGYVGYLVAELHLRLVS
jgi:Ca2+/Na+ antiporter